MRRRTALLAVPLALTLLTGSLLSGGPALAGGSGPAAQPGAPGTLVNAVPASWTPNIGPEGDFSVQVQAITEVEDGASPEIVVGGNFNDGVAQKEPQAETIDQNYLFAMDPTSGAVSTAFAPQLNDQVQALLPGPAPGEVYVGGDFSQVTAGGATKLTGHLALLNLSDGDPVAGFNPPQFNGAVNTLAMADGGRELIVGGTFTRLSNTGAVAGGIASLDPTSGAATSYINPDPTGGLGVSVNHNWPCKGPGYNPKQTCAEAAVGLTRIAVSPNGTRMVMLGNFKKVGGVSRDQVAMVDLSGSGASLDPRFDTTLYTAPCYYWGFDSYVRDVAFSPDGSYFVIAARGGSGLPDPGREGCDSVARFDTNSTGAPAWIDYSGDDTISAVAVSSSAVYVGGHQRWLNNPLAADVAGAGAVPRPGLAAVDPANGLPYSWNPGRDPRGIQVYALFLDSSGGLWVGSDTDYIGPRRYLHEKLAYFPAAGGETLPADSTPGLPAGSSSQVFIAGQDGTDSLLERGYDPTSDSVGASGAGPSATIDWSEVHGAVLVDGTLFYLCAPDADSCDANGDPAGLYSASFDGSSFGSPTYLEPFNDPVWDSVQTGSGQTYQGQPPPLYQQADQVTGMFYAAGELYYTLSGSPSLYEVSFEPESGVVGALPSQVPSSVSFSNVDGMFLAGNRLYWADSTTGALEEATFTGTQVTGTPVVADSSNDWSGQALFLGPSAPDVTTQPGAVNAVAGQQVTFSTGAAGDPATSVQWQVESGGTWTDIAGATAPSLSFTATAGQNGQSYQAVFTNALGTATTQPAALAVRTAALSAAPGSVPAGDLLTIRGANFVPGMLVTLRLDSPSGRVLGRATASGRDGFTCRLRAPAASYGAHQIVATASGSVLAHTVVRVRDNVRLTPATVGPGWRIKVTLSGLPARRVASLRLGYRRTAYRFVADSTGTASRTLVLPRRLGEGSYPVELLAGRGVRVFHTRLRVR